MELLSKMMRGAAIAATIAMLPLVLYLLLANDKATSESIESINMLQGIAAFIWAGFLLACIPSAQKNHLPYAGFIVCAIGIVIGGGLLFKLEEIAESFLRRIIMFRGDPDLTAPTLMTFIVNAPIVAGVLMLGKYLPALKKAAFAYGILAVFPLVAQIFLKMFATKKYDYGYASGSYVDSDSAKKVMVMLVVLLLICIILALVSWWMAVKNALSIDVEEEEEEDQPQDVEASLSAEQMSKLDAMTDEQLNDLISNPTLYSSSMIEGARKALVLRKSLSSIKNMSDERLLEAVHGNPMGYSYEGLDEISMELYRRQTPAFVNEVYHMSTHELQVIVQNPNAYFKGYVEQAKRVLKDRL